MSPITREEFERGRKIPPLERLVLQHLARHPNTAYSADEIGRAVGAVRGENALTDISGSLNVDSVLNTLLKEGEILKKDVGSATYFSIKLQTPIRRTG
ncbi:MAG: hypothetical protein WB778_00405 [Thermoplasmata archaeon]